MTTEPSMSRRKFLKLTGTVGAASVGIAAVTTTAGCTTTSTAKSLVEVTIGEIEALDPAFTYDSASWQIIWNIAEDLVFYEGKDFSQVHPLLCTDYTMSADGLTYTFTLKENVKFHDGSTMTAEDVKYSFDRGVKRFGDSFPALLTWLLKGGPTFLHSDATDADFNAYLANNAVQVVDSKTVKMTLDAAYPYTPFCLATASGCIISKTSHTPLDQMALGEPDTYTNSNLVGTGPYKFVEWIPATSITLEAFDDYHGTKAKIQTVTQIWSDDWSTRQLMLLNGEADCVYVPATNIAEVANFNSATGKWEAISGLVVELTDVLACGAIGCNLGISPYDNINVRKAIMHALDKQVMWENVVNKVGIIATHPVPPSMVAAFGLDMSGVKTYEYDLNKAKTFLQAAGYAAINKANMDIYYNAGNDSRKQISLLLKDRLEQTGLARVTVTELPWPTYLQQSRARTLPIQWCAWQADYPGYDNMVGAYTQSSFYFAPRVHWSSAQADARYDEIIEFATTEARRKQALVEMINICMDDAIFQWTTWPQNIGLTRDWVEYDWSTWNPLFPGTMPPYALMDTTKTA